MKPESIHWSEEAQDAHDRRLARRNVIGRDLIFRDLGIQAGRMYRNQEKSRREA